MKPFRQCRIVQACEPRPRTRMARLAGTTAKIAFYGVAVASEACSAASATQALRCSPLIAPVTLSTFPAGQDASCTKAIS